MSHCVVSESSGGKHGFYGPGMPTIGGFPPGQDAHLIDRWNTLAGKIFSIAAQTGGRAGSGESRQIIQRDILDIYRIALA